MAAHRTIKDEERAQHAQRVLNQGARARWWRRCGTKADGFWYEDAHGNHVTDECQLARLAHLAIPPGYLEVRAAPSARSRLQAICVDACGRLQYRYHSDFTARQAAKKYAKIERFGQHLPKLRQLTNAHIAEEGYGKPRVLAVMVRLINDLYFRLGSEESVERYRTYGITTLRNHHLAIGQDGQLLFKFVGKHHVQQRFVLVDAELAVLLREIKAIRGTRLFNYLDEHGKPHAVTAADVNHYIKSAMGPEFSGKDFRTWGGTLLAATLLAEAGKPENERQAHKNIVEVAKQVAERLGNTPSVCRECYIHPIVFTRYEQGITLNDFRPAHLRAIRRHQPDYEPEEIALLQLFRPCSPHDKAEA